jgi:transposase
MTIGWITLAPPERRELQRRARSRTLSAEDNKRARLMLLIAKGLSFSEICRRLNCTDRYISVWKRRFEQEAAQGVGFALPRQSAEGAHRTTGSQNPGSNAPRAQ